ncbi:hypothetical protein DFJ74DRAFT_652932 [Hyaloraphidium curvatum]|nr:hypothetical protein DFJ74DRAFT_652932 [Hyaloraphidium curvatum]
MASDGFNSQGSGGSLQNVGVAFIDVKFPPEQLEELRKKVVDEGGQLKPAGEADVLVTVLKSPSRIGRHIPREAPSVPVVTPQWISETIDAGFTQPFGEYAIEVSEEHRPRKRPRISPSPLPAPVILSPRASDDESERYTTDEEAGLPPGAGNLDPRFRNTKYECQRPTPLEHHNRELIEELEVISRDRELSFEDRHASAYRRAVAGLRAYPRDILTAVEAEKIRFVGPKIGAAIKEFLRKGHIPEARKLRADPKFRAADLFAGIYGAGPAAVKSWIAKGYRSLDDLKAGEGYQEEGAEQGKPKKPPKGDDEDERHYRGLTEKQRKGLKWYDALRETMSGADAEEIHDLVAAEVERIVPGSIVEHLDEYRRGKRKGIKNVDLLVTPPAIEYFDRLLSKLLSALDKKGLILDVLMLSDDDEDNASKTLEVQPGPGSPRRAPPSATAILMRLKALPPEADPTRKANLILRQPSSGKLRAVHIIVCPTPCRPYTLTCLTGSMTFVRSMREYLDKEKGYKISNHGLWDATTGARVADCATERDVFDKMGLPWIEPEGRNC